MAGSGPRGVTKLSDTAQKSVSIVAATKAAAQADFVSITEDYNNDELAES